MTKNPACRAQAAGTAVSTFTDALYTAHLQMLLAAKMPAAGPGQDLPSLLADLRQWQPSSSSAPPPKHLMDSIIYCAQLHSTIAWLASQISHPEAQQQLQHTLLRSDTAGRLQEQLRGIFVEPVHQRLLMSYLQRYCTGSLSDVLDTEVVRVGLGAWTQAWATAMR